MNIGFDKLRNKMIIHANKLSNIGECAERLYDELWQMAGQPKGCFEDVTLKLMQKKRLEYRTIS